MHRTEVNEQSDPEPGAPDCLRAPRSLHNNPGRLLSTDAVTHRRIGEVTRAHAVCTHSRERRTGASVRNDYMGGQRRDVCVHLEEGSPRLTGGRERDSAQDD